MALIEERSQDVAVLTIDQPERRNALSSAVKQRLAEAMDRLETDATVRAIVITGAGGNFSSGGDLAEMGTPTLAEARERFIESHRLVRAIVRSSKVVIAAVEGWAVGAGMSLALVCDTVVAAEDARFSAGFGKVGLIGDLGIAYSLARRVGEARAKQILLYAQTIGAEEAERIGLIDDVAARGNALAGAIDMAQRVRSVAPLSIGATKAMLVGDLDMVLDREREIQASLLTSQDFLEGKLAFREKRAPNFRNQ